MDSKAAKAAVKAGKALVDAGDWEAAVRELRAVAGLDGLDTGAARAAESAAKPPKPSTKLKAVLFYGLCLSRLGDAPGAAAAFRHVLAADPTSLHAKQGLADALEAAGKTDEARALLEELMGAAASAGQTEREGALAARLAALSPAGAASVPSATSGPAGAALAVDAGELLAAAAGTSADPESTLGTALGALRGSDPSARAAAAVALSLPGPFSLLLALPEAERDEAIDAAAAAAAGSELPALSGAASGREDAVAARAALLAALGRLRGMDDPSRLAAAADDAAAAAGRTPAWDADGDAFVAFGWGAAAAGALAAGMQAPDAASSVRASLRAAELARAWADASAALGRPSDVPAARRMQAEALAEAAEAVPRRAAGAGGVACPAASAAALASGLDDVTAWCASAGGGADAAGALAALLRASAAELLLAPWHRLRTACAGGDAASLGPLLERAGAACASLGDDGSDPGLASCEVAAAQAWAEAAAGGAEAGRGEATASLASLAATAVDRASGTAASGAASASGAARVSPAATPAAPALLLGRALADATVGAAAAARAWLLLASAHTLRGDLGRAAAQRCALTSAKLRPGSAAPFCLLGLCFWRGPEAALRTRARQCLLKAASLSPGHPFAAPALVDLALEAGDADAALQAARAATDAAPRAAWAWFRVAELARRGSGRAEQASDAALSESMRAYQRCVSESPGSGSAWRGLAEVYLVLGRLSAALKAAARAVACAGGPGRRLSASLGVLAAVHSAMAEHEEAVAAYEEAVCCLPGDRSAMHGAASAWVATSRQRAEEGRAVACAEAAAAAVTYARAAAGLRGPGAAASLAVEGVRSRQARQAAAAAAVAGSAGALGMTGARWPTRAALPEEWLAAVSAGAAAAERDAAAAGPWHGPGAAAPPGVPASGWKLLSDACAQAFSVCPCVFGTEALRLAEAGASPEVAASVWAAAGAGAVEASAAEAGSGPATLGWLGPRAAASAGLLPGAAEEAAAASAMAVRAHGTAVPPSAWCDLGRVLLLRALALRSAAGHAGWAGLAGPPARQGPEDDAGSPAWGGAAAADTAEAACRAYRRAIEADAGCAPAWAGLGAAEPRPAVSQRALARAVELSGAGAALCSLGTLYARAGLPALARRALVQAQASDPDNVSMWVGHGSLGEEAASAAAAARAAASFWSATSLSVAPAVAVPAALASLGLAAARRPVDAGTTPESAAMAILATGTAGPAGLVDARGLLRGAAEADPCSAAALAGLAAADEDAGDVTSALRWARAAEARLAASVRALSLAAEAPVAAPGGALLAARVNVARLLLLASAAAPTAAEGRPLLAEARRAAEALADLSGDGHDGVWPGTGDVASAIAAIRAAASPGSAGRPAVPKDAACSGLRILDAQAAGDAASLSALAAANDGSAEEASLCRLAAALLGPGAQAEALLERASDAGLSGASLGVAAREAEADAASRAALLGPGPGAEAAVRRSILRFPTSARLWRQLQSSSVPARGARRGAMAGAAAARAAAAVATDAIAQRASLRGAVIDDEAAAELLGATDAAAAEARRASGKGDAALRARLREAAAAAGPLDGTRPEAWIAEAGGASAGSMASASACRAGVQSRPGSAAAWIRLALAEGSLGRGGAANRAMTAADRLGPEHPCAAMARSALAALAAR